MSWTVFFGIWSELIDLVTWKRHCWINVKGFLIISYLKVVRFNLETMDWWIWQSVRSKHGSKAFFLNWDAIFMIDGHFWTDALFELKRLFRTEMPFLKWKFVFELNGHFRTEMQFSDWDASLLSSVLLYFLIVVKPTIWNFP